MTITSITVAAIGSVLLMGIMLPMANAQAPPCFGFANGQTQVVECPAYFRPQAPAPYYSTVENGYGNGMITTAQASPGPGPEVTQPQPQPQPEQPPFTQEIPLNQNGAPDMQVPQIQNETGIYFPAEEQSPAKQNETLPPTPEPQPEAQPIEPEPEPPTQLPPEPEEPTITTKIPLNKTQQEIITIEEIAGLNKTTHEKSTITIVEGNKTTHRETTTTEVPL